MMQDKSPTDLVLRRTANRGLSWAPVLFLLGFLAAIGVLAYFLLEPMMRIASTAEIDQRKRISAYALLALCILILVLLVGLIFTLRVGRRLAALSDKKNKPTVYTDAWTESAKRMPTPPPEELEGDKAEEGNGRPLG